MAPTYSPLGSDENQRAHHGQRTPVWIRILWFFQAGVALLRICLVGLMLVAALLIASMIDAPALVFVFVILVLGLDIFLSSFVVLQVWKQLFRIADKRTTLRREVYKAGIATWLFVSFASLPKNVKPVTALDAQQRAAFEAIVRKIWIGQLLVTVVIAGLFYPPLWVAFKKRNAEKEGADQGRGEIELEDHEIGLLGRTSVDTLDGLVEEDEEVGRARVKL